MNKRAFLRALNSIAPQSRGRGGLERGGWERLPGVDAR